MCASNAALLVSTNYEGHSPAVGQVLQKQVKNPDKIQAHPIFDTFD